MHMIISKHIRCINPDPVVYQYCKEHLEVPNPDYANKVRMGFWTGKTPKTLCLYEEDGEDLILPYGCLDYIFGQENWDFHWTTVFHEPTKVKLGGTIPLWDYQEEAVTQAIYYGMGILQSKAGSGKTQMGLAIIEGLGQRALWLTHTKDLLTQSMNRAGMYFDSSKFGTITEGKVKIGETITFATVQTMASIDLAKYQDTWDVVIVDECHRVAGSPSKMTMFYKVVSNLNARHKYGLSATLHRADGLMQCCYALLGNVCYTVPDSAVADKTMQVSVEAIESDLAYSGEFLNTDGTINYTSLVNYIASDRRRNELIIDLIEDDYDHSILILGSRLEQLKTLMDMLPANLKKDAVMVSGKMTSNTGKRMREEAIEDMRNGNKKYLFATYQLAKEGLDIPRLDRLIMATPEKDYAVIAQSIGRIARTFPGKWDPVCYDIVDSRIGYCLRKYKERVKTYKKEGCLL